MLVFAWLLYVGAMAGGAYYAFLSPTAEPPPGQPDEQGEVSLADPDPVAPEEPANADHPAGAETAAHVVAPQD
ncbi:MAG: hypothetical protein ACREDZ_00460, partial [Kiloniellales bacterium]